MKQFEPQFILPSESVLAVQKLTLTGETYTLFKSWGWQNFRVEKIRFYFGTYNKVRHFNVFYGVKIGPIKLWCGRHVKKPVPYLEQWMLDQMNKKAHEQARQQEQAS